MIKKLKADIPQWKIFSIFQASSTSGQCDQGQISFKQFLRSCLNHTLMEGLMNNDYALMAPKNV